MEFGKLTVTGRDFTKTRAKYYLCKCRCGTKDFSITEKELLAGKKSCGCIKKRKGFNKYKIDGDTTIIYFENRMGEVIMEGYIDTEDLHKIIKQNISYSAAWDKDIEDYYAKGTEYYWDKNGERKGKIHYLHRDIMDAKKGEYVDHIEHKPHSSLDNRKGNLRITDNVQNNENKNGKYSNNTTGYRNVIYDSDSGKYFISLCINYKRFRVSKLYTDVHEAGRDAEKYRQIYYGEYAGIS